MADPCVLCHRPLPWWGWCSYCMPGTPRPPDMYGPHGTALHFSLDSAPVASKRWAVKVNEWRQRQAIGFDRGELALPDAGGASR